MSRVVALYAASFELADQIGNKAAGLGELHRAGFRVPDGFCITVEAFRERLQSGVPSERVTRDVLDWFEKLRKPVAVRSSSPAEDRAEASFAGQYQTILGVRTAEDLIAAIATCWKSAESAEARAYLRDKGGVTGEVDMALVVQELVPATSAGVLFTVHPVTERADHLVVNANYGLGESVVSGRAEPDTFVLEKATGRALDVRIGRKAVASRLTGDGVGEVAVPAADQARPSLSDQQLQTLAEAARRLEDRFDFPMDAEWAFEGDELHLLQARPVTAGAAAYFNQFLDDWASERGLASDPEALWARGSPLSGLPVSPLYYSEMAAFFCDMFPDVAKLHGAEAARQKSFHYFNGYTYTAASFASRADPGGEVRPLGFFSDAWRSNLRIAAEHPATLSFWANIDYYYRRWAEDWTPGLDARRPDWDRAQPEEIRAYIEYVETQRRERSVVAALGVGYAGDYLGLLAHVLGRWARDCPADTLGVLTSGLEGSLTHAENVGIWVLAQAAEARPAVRDAILASNYDGLGVVEGGDAFLRQLDAFRAARPHRGASDRDLLQPRWGDSRSALLGQIGAMLRLGAQADPEAAHARTAARRRARELEVLALMGRGPLGALRAAIFEGVLRPAQRYWIHRDNQRHTFDRYFWELRCAYRAMGRRLAERGDLDDPDDIFFVGKSEIYGRLDGRLPGDRIRARAAWRRRWWQDASRREPPALLKGNQPFERDEDTALSAGDLKGVGGAPGVVTGPVRHVRNLAELALVAPGDIVVTHAIDPAWTPAFAIIGGVISEEGGMLSHATVLGREYGLPVVVGVAGATSRLQDGQEVRINGTTGVIVASVAEESGAKTD